MEEKKTNAQAPNEKRLGPSKREKTITAIIAVVFVVGLVIIALVQKANGAF